MSEKIEDGGYAFPVQSSTWDYKGLTVRDWFAGQALSSGIIDGHDLNDNQLTELFGPHKANIRQEEIAAAIAYRIADAMLAARKGGAS